MNAIDKDKTALNAVRAWQGDVVDIRKVRWPVLEAAEQYRNRAFNRLPFYLDVTANAIRLREHLVKLDCQSQAWVETLVALEHEFDAAVERLKEE